MSNKSKTIVTLRVYRGAEMLYTGDGKAKNENQPVKIQHNSFEWINFLKNSNKNGYAKVEVEAVNNVSVVDGKETVEPVSDISSFEVEVANATKKEVLQKTSNNDAKMAQLEKQNEILQAQLDEMKKMIQNGSLQNPNDLTLNAPQTVSPNDVEKPLDEMNVSELREKYKEVFGKNPTPRDKKEDLITKIKDAK